MGAAHDVVAAYGVFLWTGRVCSGFLAATARGRPTLQSILAILLLVNVAPGPVCSLHIHKNGLLSNQDLPRFFAPSSQIRTGFFPDSENVMVSARNKWITIVLSVSVASGPRMDY